MMQQTMLLATALLTGLLAGLFYGYSCSVNPGLKPLSNAEYLKAMQSINKAILNPAFFASFGGSLIILIASAIVLYRAQGMTSFYLMLAALIVYLVGVIGLTMLGNVPLNNNLASLDLTNIPSSSLQSERDKFEMPWNRYHFIRTVAACISFLLALLSILFHSK